MKPNFFLEVEFLSLVVVSFVLPMAILIGLSVTRRIARVSVLLFGVLLICLSGVDFVMLQRIAISASRTRELMRDPVFGPALSVAFYILPVVFAGIGTNIVSHVIIEHLNKAEKEFDREGSDS